jgi:hypothetical protein
MIVKATVSQDPLVPTTQDESESDLGTAKVLAIMDAERIMSEILSPKMMRL